MFHRIIHGLHQIQGTGELNNVRFGKTWRKYQDAAKPMSIFSRPIPTIGGK